MEAEPFLLAAAERNPVFLEALRNADETEVLARLETMPGESIYPENGRLAQPDEVWNYRRGDGAEKALLLAVFLRRRNPGAEVHVRVAAGRAIVQGAGRTVAFDSAKGLRDQNWVVDR